MRLICTVKELNIFGCTTIQIQTSILPQFKFLDKSLKDHNLKNNKFLKKVKHFVVDLTNNYKLIFLFLQDFKLLLRYG